MNLTSKILTAVQKILFAATLGVSALAFTPTASIASDWSLFGNDKKVEFIVVSNIGAYRPEDVEIYKQTVINRLRAVTKDHQRRSSRHTRVEFIFTSDPSSSSFSGTPAQIFNAGAEVMDMAEFKPRYNDIWLVYRHILSRIEVLKPDSVNITHIGPMFWAKAGCQSCTEIVLPQELPSRLPIARTLAHEKVKSFNAYMVHPSQQQPFYEHIKYGSASQRQLDGDLEVNIFTPAMTIDELELRDALKAATQENSSKSGQVTPKKDRGYDDYGNE